MKIPKWMFHVTCDEWGVIAFQDGQCESDYRPQIFPWHCPRWWLMQQQREPTTPNPLALQIKERFQHNVMVCYLTHQWIIFQVKFKVRTQPSLPVWIWTWLDISWLPNIKIPYEFRSAEWPSLLFFLSLDDRIPGI